MDIISKRFSLNWQNKNKLEYLNNINSEFLQNVNILSSILYDNKDELIKQINNISTKKLQNKYYKQLKSKYKMQWSLQKVTSYIIDQYYNMIKKINKKLEFKIQKKMIISYYKRNTKNNKKGDIKQFKLSYNFKSDIVYFINHILKFNFNNSEELYNILLLLKDKYNTKHFEKMIMLFNEYKEKNIIDRIINLVKEKRERLITKYIKKIEFKSIAIPLLPSKNRLIIDNENNKLKYWIKIQKDKYLPLQINNKYHGNLDELNFKNINIKKYNKSGWQMYVTKEKENIIYKETDKIQQIDVNSQNNLFVITVSSKHKNDNTFITKSFKLDKDFINDKIISILKKLDKIGYQNLNEKQIELNKYIHNYIEYKINYIISQQIKWLENMNVSIIIMEDLNLSQSKSLKYVIDKDLGINQNRINRLLRLSSIKKWFISQQEKHLIQVKLINPQYTSQRCPICGNIDKENRKSQEVFKCINCGYKNNQDINSTINMIQIYRQDVLDDVNKIKKHEKIKEFYSKINNFIIKDPIIMQYN